MITTIVDDLPRCPECGAEVREVVGFFPSELEVLDQMLDPESNSIKPSRGPLKLSPCGHAVTELQVWST